MVCTFFGNRDASETIQPDLETVLRNLIEQHGVTRFYVGHQGNFDRMVENTLKSLLKEYPHICHFVVLAYFPVDNRTDNLNDYTSTIFPDGLEKTPPKFAIDKRNRWMIRQSDFVVTYVQNPFGGAGKYKALAERKGLTVIELAQ